jgi:hypothetical protein
MKMLTLAPLALLLAACASSPSPAPAPAPVVIVAPKPAPLDPAGSYEFTTVVDGQTVTGTMDIAGTPGAYTGKILTNLFPEIPIVGAAVEGNAINVRASMPDGELAIHMVFEAGPDFKGNWALGGDTGDFNGKKKPKM